jgi:ABC-type lipoprotein export system ATPase subunit
MVLHSASGSNWNIWDLHVHSPASFGGNEYAAFIGNVSQSKAAALGINDYCSIAGYKKIIEMGGIPGKAIFPVIEFRMHNIVANRKGAPRAQGGTKINFHLIFTNEPSRFIEIETFVNSLGCFNTSGDEAQLGSIPSNDLMKITLDFPSVLKKLKELNLREHCLIWLPYDEYGGIDDIDPDDNFFKLHLIKEADIIGSAREKQINFFKWKDPKFSEAEYQQFMTGPKPCIKGSDSHELDYPFGKLRNERSEPMEKYCWIKADLTFNGLKQVVYEPDRVSIAKEPELITRKKAYPHKFILALKVDKENAARTSELWFQNVNIPFNAGLIAIIGKKGNGKSAVADVIGLCANSKNSKDDLSFLHKDKFKNPRANKAKDFKGNLVWLDGTDSGDINLANEIDPLQEERVKYIPQNYLEKLCVNEEQQEFEEELKKIIFAHIPASERLGQNSLDDLILLKQKAVEEGIGKLRIEVSRINKEIARLEAKKKQSYKTAVIQQIANKEAELKHHELNKPVEKPRPDEDAVHQAENRAVLEEINRKQLLVKQLVDQRQALDYERGKNNISINELESAKVEITQLDNLITKGINDKKPILEKHSIDINDVITHFVDVTQISEKIDSFRARNFQISASLNGTDETPGINFEIEGVITAIDELQGRLAQSEKEYQEYLQSQDAWERRRQEIIGTAHTLETLSFYRDELAYIDGRLDATLASAFSQRMQIAKEIFALKEQLLTIYGALYQPVTYVLQKESHFVEEYNIKVNASLVIRAFSDRFLSYISQKSRGSFSGATEGREMIEQMLAVYSVTSSAELEVFLQDLVGALQSDKRAGYNDEPRNPDEQLRKDTKIEDLYDFIFNLDYIEPQFRLQLGTKQLRELSPGERGAILLIFYLFLDIDNKPLVIDQPEENLDNESIYYYLVHFIKKAKQKRQIILITHNPNLAVVCDAEQIIHMAIDKQNLNKVSFVSGAIENPEIAKRVVNILEGTKPAFDNRRLKYSTIVS